MTMQHVDSLHERVDSLQEGVVNLQEHVDRLHERVDSLQELALWFLQRQQLRQSEWRRAIRWKVGRVRV